MSEDSDGPGAAAGSESKRTGTGGKLAGPASVPENGPGAPANDPGAPEADPGAPAADPGAAAAGAGTPAAPATDEGASSASSANSQPVPKPRAGPVEAGEASAGEASAGEASAGEASAGEASAGEGGAASEASGKGEAARKGVADQEDERAEIERLRAEVRDLRTRQGEGDDGVPRKGRWRAPVSAVLIVLACILAPVSVLGVWGANQVSNTDRFVANMQPLITQPPIQQALTARITTEITSRLDVQALTTQAAGQLQANHLPRLATLLRSFSGQIASGVNSAIHTAVARVVASPAMAVVWTTALRTAHTGLVRVLSGQGGGAVDVVNNEVVLNLGPLITQAKTQLVAQGLTVADRIPNVNATFPLFEAPNLAKAQQGYRLAVTLRWVLPILTLVLFAVGIYIARRHRRALIGAALGLAASMLVLGIGLTIFRSVYLNSVPPNASSTAAASAYDTLIRFIRQGLRVLLVVGLIVAAGAFLSGPTVTAVRIRRAVTSGIDWLRMRGERAGVRTGPVGEWTASHKNLLRAIAVALFALIFVFWGHPTLAVVIWLVVLLLVVLGLIELIGGRSAGPQAAEQR